MNPLNQHRWLRPILPEELEALRASAEADQHAVIAPTHVFVKDGEVIGYASLAAVPLLLPWFHSEKCKAADSVYFINVMENLLASMLSPDGHGMIAVPVAAESPFQPCIEKLGYTRAGEFSLTLKKVR